MTEKRATLLLAPGESPAVAFPAHRVDDRLLRFGLERVVEIEAQLDHVDARVDGILGPEQRLDDETPGPLHSWALSAGGSS